MSKTYWVQLGTKVQGPYDQLQIRGLVSIGQLTPGMEISIDGVQWRSAALVRGLFPTETVRSTEPLGVPQLADTSVPTSPSGAADSGSTPARRQFRVSNKLAITFVALLAVTVGIFQALRVDSSTACSDSQAVNLATSIIYEDIAKRTQGLQLAAAMGQQVSDADLTAMELRIRRYINLGLSGISTVGKSAKTVQCKANLNLTVTPEGKKSDLTYFGMAYNNGDAISYSVRDSDDGKNIYVRIPAE